MDAQSSWSYALWMLLFVVVNAHAAAASIRALAQEYRLAALRRVRKTRKRSLAEHETIGSSRCAVVFSRTAPTRRCKRRRLQAAATPCSTLPRETLACPWPRHVSFLAVDIVGDTEQLIASWLAQPFVASAMTKLREGLQAALQEVLVSCLSFVLCAIAVFVLRKYSTLVVGVSVDLGAFSLEV